MENIEIKRSKNKRSIQSLIQQSALDNSFNYQAHELRKAFNETLQAMNAKHLQQQRENERLKIMLRQCDQNKAKYERRIDNMQGELTQKCRVVKELTEAIAEAKKRLHYLEYKLQTISQNRHQLQASLLDNESKKGQQQEKNAIVSEAYKEMEKVVARKIESFTLQIKKMAMSPELEERIQIFLEQLIYLNPHSEYKILQQIKKDNRERLYGKIIKDRHQRSRQNDQWKNFQKSLEKLKALNESHKTPTDKKLGIQEIGEKSVSKEKRRRLFNP